MYEVGTHFVDRIFDGLHSPIDDVAPLVLLVNISHGLEANNRQDLPLGDRLDPA